MGKGGGGGGHGPSDKAIVLTRLDGTAMSKREVIKKRRGALKWLPVFFSNDLVHGSWYVSMSSRCFPVRISLSHSNETYFHTCRVFSLSMSTIICRWFVFGSFGGMASAVLPLIQQYETFYKQHDDMLPSVDFTLTWSLLIFSGFWFTVGSWAFVRAFEEPPRKAVFSTFKHLRTDELLGAWCFMLGTAPAVPYTLVYFLIDPTFTFLGALAGSGVFVLGSVVFVMASYPTNQTTAHGTKKRKNYVLPLALKMFGARIWVVKHLQNDWLAGTWFLLWAIVFFTIFSFILLFSACETGNPEQIFLWLSSAVNSFFFLIGSLYFVSGSYPHAQQFYYAIDRGKKDGPLEYDAPENLPDYSDPSDQDDVADLFFKANKAKQTTTTASNASSGGGPGILGHSSSGGRDVEANVQLESTANPLHTTTAHILAGANGTTSSTVPSSSAGAATTTIAPSSSSSSSSKAGSGGPTTASSSMHRSTRWGCPPLLYPLLFPPHSVSDSIPLILHFSSSDAVSHFIHITL